MAHIDITVKGAWQGGSAGGYGSPANPQFALTVKQTSVLKIELNRTDTGVKCGLILFCCKNTGTGRKLDNIDKDSVEKSKYLSGFKVNLDCTLEPSEFPYVLSPSLQASGTEGTFDIRISGSGAVDCVPLRDVKSITVKSQWKDSTAAGYKNPRNPQFFCYVKERCDAIFTLDRDTKADGVVMTIMQSSGARDKRRVQVGDVVTESRFLTTSQLVHACSLEPGAYIVMPSRQTTDPGSFTLTLACTASDAQLLEIPLVQAQTVKEVSCAEIIAKCQSPDHPALLDKNPIDEIIAYCTANGVRFKDAVFPPSERSVNSGRPDKKMLPPVEWKRCREYAENPDLFQDGIDVDDMIQGGVGDCWWCQGVANIAQHAERVYKLFQPGHLTDCGVMSVAYCLNSKWYWVIVDDYIPTRSEKPCFARSSADNEVWVCLLEKAYAKVYGSYQDLIAHSPSEALAALTGGTVDNIFVSQMPPDELWTRLVRYCSEGWMIGASSEKTSGQGIVQDHAYSIMAAETVGEFRLVKFRNTWGKSEWTGEWSDNSDLWAKHPQVQRQLNHTSVDDGRFWMPLSAVREQFNTLSLCRLLDGDYPFATAVESRWRDVSAAGYGKTDNPQMELIVKEELGLSFNLTRLDKGEKVGLCFWLCRAPPSGRLFQLTEDVTVQKSRYITTNAVSMEQEKLAPGRYIVMACLSTAGMAGSFRLAVQASKAIELNVLPSLQSAVVEGGWAPPLNGGYKMPDNPQVSVSVGGYQPSPVSFTLERTDGGASCGVCMFLCEKSGRVQMAEELDAAVNKSAYSNTANLNAVMSLEPGKTYALVITLQNTELTNAKFKLLMTSDTVVNAALLPAPVRSSVDGQWQGATSAGNGSSAARAGNPQILMELTESADVTIVLERPADAVKDGLQVFVCKSSGTRVATCDDSVTVSKSKYLTTLKVTTFGTLEAGKYVIVPCHQATGPAGEGKFTVSVDTAKPVRLQRI
eukprot:TRINITY_DN12797_c0_g1_i1.p1 TRINITY_DN12797_c0_g1~~TRINITY_DN12797_c0_g1_i1.p1  ORF type:complete len:977 (-),score=197.34 TRINITY_DN12797_c0_g1_i1:179-3109(-)